VVKRIGGSLALVLSLSVGATASVLAGSPQRGCPASASGFEVFAIDPVVGDGLPAPGENAWWDMTLLGLAEEGLTPQQAAADFGFASVEELYEFIQANLRGLDKNGDNSFCAKPFPPHQNGQPAYFFNAVDNKARAH
jgi:hypothetical protein